MAQRYRKYIKKGHVITTYPLRKLKFIYIVIVRIRLNQILLSYRIHYPHIPQHCLFVEGMFVI